MGKQSLGRDVCVYLPIFFTELWNFDFTRLKNNSKQKCSGTKPKLKIWKRLWLRKDR